MPAAIAPSMRAASSCSKASNSTFCMVIVSASMRLRKVWIGGSSSFNPPSSDVSDKPVMVSNVSNEQPSILPTCSKP
ncbi:hypothetical protein BN949_05508 [Agrobacterium tumefaciens]|nr:hypothetical protein BN949_05508 [Agrobacterium tumefaciens]